MAIEVEDGTGLADADSYISLADADTYATAYGLTTWTGTDAAKETALRQATEYLDTSFDWIGELKTNTQALGWPRDDAEDRDGRELIGVPVRVQRATVQVAALALSGALLVSESEGIVSSVSAGSVSVSFKNGQTASEAKKFQAVTRLLVGLFRSSAADGGAFVRFDPA